MRKIYFTPGPSQLYFTVEDHLKTALREQISSISHRSKQFESIYEKAASGIKELLDVPDNFKVLFTSSATEVFYKQIQSCANEHSYHLISGAFSQRFHDIALDCDKQAENHKVDFGKSPKWGEFVIPKEAELIALTQNETSAGTAINNDLIHQIRIANPKALIAVDMVSSAPYAKMDWSKVDSAFFSVQKGFGLPAGLGVWLVNNRCIERARQINYKGHHNLLQLLSKAEKNQNPETPNVLGIYLLRQVAQDMLEKGIDKIRHEMEYKSDLLYFTLNKHPQLSAFVENKEDRSKTVAVAKVMGSPTDLIKSLEAKGIVIGTGYGQYKDQHIRIANFPTHSKEQVEMLSDLLLAIEV